jgi:glycerol-3-phosphate acyltransferase PlsY
MPASAPTWALVAATAYLIGSIPWGLLIGKVFYGIDVRDYGSRRTGATNVLRTMGKGAALAASVLDVTKGVAAVLLARWLLPEQPWAHALAALLVAVGHNWPIFVGFRGGRGVLVSIGAVGVLYWPVVILLLATGAVVMWRSRFVSLTSIMGAALTPVFFIFFYVVNRGRSVPIAYVVYSVVGAALVIASHRDNIQRLRAGTESRLGQRVSRPATT